MGSHAYSDLIFGIPVGNSEILREETETEDSFELDELVSGTQFAYFRHGHSACDCTYYVGISIQNVSLADDAGRSVDIVPSTKWLVLEKELSKLLKKNSIPHKKRDIGLYLVLAFDE